MRCISILAIILSCLIGSSHAGSLAIVTDKQGKLIAVLDGEIVAGDGDAFHTLVGQARAQGHPLREVHLNSPGGSLAVGAKIAAIVRKAAMTTVVPKDGLCASACFLVFAGGSSRYASPSARIGVHGAYEQGAEADDISATTGDMIRFAKSLGVPGKLLAKMAAVPHDGMYWLSGHDLSTMAVTLSDGPAQSLPLRASLPSQ